jgi:hypothetical protein
MDTQVRASDTLFHSDWKWIMVVKDKIDSLKGNVIIEESSITKEQCVIRAMKIPFNNKRSDRFISVQGIGDVEAWEGYSENKLESTYKAVVEFIKWYNSI